MEAGDAQDGPLCTEVSIEPEAALLITYRGSTSGLTALGADSTLESGSRAVCDLVSNRKRRPNNNRN